VVREEEQEASGTGAELPPVLTTVDLDAPRDRAAERAAIGHRKQASGRIHGWSTKWNWVERAAAWDRHCDQYIQNKSLNAAQEAFKRHQSMNKAIAVACGVVAPTFLRRLNTAEGKSWLENIPMDELLRLVIELGSRAKGMQEAERIALGIHVSADEEAIGEFIWELRLKQPPAHSPEHTEFGDERDDEDFDPFDVPPAEDPVR
jgi:hypothetical protein